MLVVFLDCIVVKIRDNQRIVNKAIFVALRINLSGNKELLGLWLAENEEAKFWLSILTELKNRGVEDILIAVLEILLATLNIAIADPVNRATRQL